MVLADPCISHSLMETDTCVRYKWIVFPVCGCHTGIYAEHILPEQPVLQFLIQPPADTAQYAAFFQIDGHLGGMLISGAVFKGGQHMNTR